MKNINGFKHILLFSFAFLFLSATISYSPEPLDPHFTDPTKVYEMPAEWVKKPIKYAPSASDADTVVTLDQHLYPALLPLIQKYAKKHNLKIVVTEGTCGITAGKIERKETDIAGLCCPPGKTDRLPGLRFYTLGAVAVALLVHPTNPIDNVAFTEAKQIFAGSIYRWEELKAPKDKKLSHKRIQPITRLHCKMRPAEWQLLLKSEDLFSVDVKDVGTIPDMISQVAKNPLAIGYEVLWHTKYMKEVKAVKIDGYSPYEQKHLISGRYPLFRVYNLMIWEGKGLENPKAKSLLKYLLKEVEHLGTEHHIIPAASLRKAGWRFYKDELIGRPKQK